LEWSVEDSKTVQREEEALLCPYDSQKKWKWMTADPYEAGDGEIDKRETRQNQNTSTNMKMWIEGEKSTINSPQQNPTQTHSTTGEKNYNTKLEREPRTEKKKKIKGSGSPFSRVGLGVLMQIYSWRCVHSVVSLLSPNHTHVPTSTHIRSLSFGPHNKYSLLRSKDRWLFTK